MGFIRFVLARKHPESGLHEGLFSLAYKLRRDPEVPAEDREELARVMDWFDENLPVPGRFNRSNSKGQYRRNTKGIAWLRDSAQEHISRMNVVNKILESQGNAVEMICEARVGYIVYEDDAQVIAEPFPETKTGRAK